jgi:serine/threonine protein kinase
MMDVLGSGRSGAVYRARFLYEIVAIKACDIWQVPHCEAEILSEIDIYMVLERLQGDVIPQFKEAGYSAGGLLRLITELSGSPIDTNNLSDLERGEIITALSRIHSEGVIHNDIRPENILIEHHPKSFTIKIIDFALSKQSTSKNEAETEMRSLKWMLGYRITDQQKKRNWKQNNGPQKGKGGATKCRGKRHRLCSNSDSNPETGCLQGGKEKAVVGKHKLWCS